MEVKTYSTTQVVFMGTIAPFRSDTLTQSTINDFKKRYSQLDSSIPKYKRNVIEDNNTWSTAGIKNVTAPQELSNISKNLEEMKIKLGIPVKDMAKILNISRQSFYNYLNESQMQQQSIKEDTLERIYTLHEIINSISANFPHSPSSMIKNYSYQNKTLFDLLTTDSIDKQAILTVAHKLAEEMKKIKASSKDKINNKTLYQLTKHA